MHLQCNRFRFNLTKSTKYEEYIYIYNKKNKLRYV